MMLLIPIKVRALPVGRLSSNTHFSGFSYDMSKLGYVYENTESPLFQDSDKKSGIYLHWRLPDCFTHGIQDEKTGKLIYRLAPNRWSVTRLWVENHETIKSKTFLLESDILSREKNAENMNSSSVSWTTDQTKPYRFLGRSFDAANPPKDYPDNGDEHIRLTAVSQSCPFFAAYAPACQNVFGFVDYPADEKLSHVTLSYIICGWYAVHDEPEPCSVVQNLQELEQTLGLTLEGDTIPERAFCHGIIEQIYWETENTVYHTGTPDDPEPGEIATMPELGVGNTAAEALAAVLNPHGKQQEHLLHHYLSGNGNELDCYYGTAKADSRIQQSHFYTHAGFTLDTYHTTDEPNETKKDSIEPFYTLYSLREKQRALQLTYAEYLQKQRQVYEKWYLHYYSDTTYYRSLYKQQMQKALTDAQNLSLNLSNMQAEIFSLEKQLQHHAPYPLVQETEEFFYTPAEPVVLIAQLAPANRIDQKEGCLFCRTEEQTITALYLDNISPLTGQKLVSLDIAPSLNLPTQLDTLLQQCILACVTEGIFLSRSFAPFLARTACSKAGLSPTEDELSWIVDQIEQMQKTKDSHFQGLFPDDCALSCYQPSWSPLIIEWETIYYPDRKLLNANPSLKNWVRRQEDFTFCGNPKEIITTDNAYPVSGRLFISDTASKQFTTLAKELSNDILLKSIRRMQYLSQALDGFHSNLLMRDPSIAMELFSFDESEQKLMEQLKRLHPSVLGERPLFDELFAPIRGGFLSIRKLRLIDEMGYYQDIDTPSVYAGEGLLAPGFVNPVQYVMLPPRLTQPLFLSAFLADASHEKIQESFPFPEATPICGYLVANYLDQSIMVYTEQGDYACNIHLSQTGANIQIQNAPLQHQSPIPPVNLNPQLAAFLNGLLAEGPEALKDMLSLLNQRQLLIRTGNHAKHTIDFFGKPIALVRTVLKLSLYGEPEEYRHNIDGGETDPTYQTDITALSLPVQIGQPDNPLDGVFGFFEENNYQRFHSFPEVCQSLTSDYILPSSEIYLTVKKQAPPRQITLLTDPYAEINLITGFLPLKTLRIPQQLVTQALDALSVSYFCAPVLCDDNLNGLPIPHTDSLSYYWVTEAQNNPQNIREIIPKDSLAEFSNSSFSLQEGYVTILEKEEPEN